MADSKISALSAVTTLAGTEEFVAAVSGVSNKITAANLAKFMPGYEIGYDEITSNVTVASTTESSGTTIIACAAHTFDGSAVLAEFFSSTLDISNTSAGEYVVVSLFEGATQIGELGVIQQPSNVATLATPFIGKLRFTPTAASHTYTVTAFKSAAGAATVQAGVRGTAAQVAAYIRFIKV